MVTLETAKKGLYIGTGVGLVLFVLLAMIPSSLIGGAIGLKVSGLIFGAPVKATLLPRMLTAVFMVAGILGGAVTFIVGGSFLGWTAGYVVDAARAEKGVAAHEKAGISH
jgi:predicted cobalt transporter CbtA